MALRHLQLLRNKPIAKQGREAAKNAAKTAAADLKDGELIVARYLIDTGGTPSETNTAIALGFRVDDGTNEAHTVFYDQRELEEKISGLTGSTEALEKAVGVGHNATAITFNEGSHYVGTTNSASGAIQSLDTSLYATSGKVDEVRAAIGSSAETLEVNGHYVSTVNTVKEAVTALDNNLYTVSGKADSALTYVSNIDSVVGVQNTDTQFTTTGTVASSQTTVKGAVEALDAAITSGDSNLDALIAAVGATKGQTGMTYPSANYIGSDTSVSGALMTLDSTVKGVRDDVDTVSGKVDNAQTALGTTSTTLGVDGNYVTTVMTVQTAVDTLDDVEKATRDTIGGMNVDGTSGLTLSGQHYISDDTTVVSALTDLDSSLFELSGTVASNKVNGINPILATLTTSGTDVSLKLDNVITDSSVSETVDEPIHKNIIKTSSEGLYALADLHYAPATNVLTFINSNGKRDIQLTGTKILSSSTFDGTTEELVLDFVNFSGGTDTVRIPLAGLLDEFEFAISTEAGSVVPVAHSEATDENPERHNVYLKEVRQTSGATEVVGELSIFDCGTY